MRLNTPTFPFIPQAMSYTYTGPLVGAPIGPISEFLSGQLIGIIFQNLSINSQLRITFRVGIEISCAPGSAYTPFMSAPRQADMKALDAYFTLSGRMNDAYPSAYNDWDLLWKGIKGIAGKVLRSPLTAQVLKSVPIAGPGLELGRQGLVSILNRPKKKKNGTSLQKVANKTFVVTTKPSGQQNITSVPKAVTPVSTLPPLPPRAASNRGRRRR